MWIQIHPWLWSVHDWSIYTWTKGTWWIMNLNLKILKAQSSSNMTTASELRTYADLCEKKKKIIHASSCKARYSIKVSLVQVHRSERLTMLSIDLIDLRGGGIYDHWLNRHFKCSQNCEECCLRISLVQNYNPFPISQNTRLLLGNGNMIICIILYSGLM